MNSTKDYKCMGDINQRKLQQVTAKCFDKTKKEEVGWNQRCLFRQKE